MLLIYGFAIYAASLFRYVAAYWTMPDEGIATMTHYDLPLNYIAACGCTGRSTHYPTAALSAAAYGSSQAYGPSCGRCFKLTFLNTYTPTPPFSPVNPNSIVIKVTDLCPAGPGSVCQATPDHPNEYGALLNFDLAYPSPAISRDFYPTNSTYGYDDFGVWNMTYQAVPCIGNWDGFKDAAAMGSASDQGDYACCPGEPSANLTCPSYSETHQQPPNTTTSSAPITIPLHTSISSASIFISLFTLLLPITLYLL